MDENIFQMNYLRHMVHILYAGLGGHGNVFRNFVQADVDGKYAYKALFYGIEPLRNEYRDFVMQHEIPYLYVSKNKGLDLYFFKKIYDALSKLQPQIVFLHGSYLIIPVLAYAKKHNATVIVRETQANQLKTKTERILLRWALLHAHHVVFLTPEFKREVLEKYTARCRVSVIPNGLNISLFTPKAIHEKVVKLVMVSRIVPIKDHITLLQAFKRLKEMHPHLTLTVAGDGTALPELKRWVDKENLHDVHFPGAVDTSAVVCLLGHADIYVHSTLGETMSTSLMQAMAAGLPIVASDVSGVNNMLQHEQTALLAPVQAPKAWAEAISLLIGDVGLRQRLSMNAREKAELTFSHTAMFAAYHQLIEEK
jgi:glycosyltransferase involved in cell wall biosynthesis